ncbi:hypothetical protein L1O48_03910 [Ligilactobacillus equi]|uniref:hypothetical protein n=1 Tax=Ligilactobacillus equi TaxID=137357 RepID=UPI002ED54210
MRLWEKIAVTGGILATLAAGTMVANKVTPDKQSSEFTISEVKKSSSSKVSKNSSQKEKSKETSNQVSSQVSSSQANSSRANSSQISSSQVNTNTSAKTASSSSVAQGPAVSSQVQAPKPAETLAQDRLSQNNLAISQIYGDIPLIRNIDVPSGHILNASINGDRNDYSVTYGLGSVATELNADPNFVPLVSLSVTTYGSASEAQANLQANVIDTTGLPVENIAGQTVSVDAGAGQRYYSWQTGNWYANVHTSVVDGSDANVAEKIQAVANVTKPQTSLGIVDYMANGAKLSWQEGSQVYHVTADSLAQASQAAMSVK